MRFKGNIWAEDLAEIGSLIYLLRTIDLFTKNTWVKHLKAKKEQSFLSKS